jgi:hypothetical protein
MPAYRDPDDALVVLFKNIAQKNAVKSLAEGRDIFDDVEVCEIRAPGSKEVKVFPATGFSHWAGGEYGEEQYKVSYAERFPHQYQQFKRKATQTKSGTPLEYARFLSEARRAELRAQNVYTVEQLAEIDGAELKNLGPGGRDMKNQAVEFIAEASATAPNKQMMAELEALKARNAVLEEDLQFKRTQEDRAHAEFEEMTPEELRDFITTNTGQAPLGTLNKKTLVRMAINARPERAA